MLGVLLETKSPLVTESTALTSLSCLSQGEGENGGGTGEIT